MAGLNQTFHTKFNVFPKFPILSFSTERIFEEQKVAEEFIKRYETQRIQELQRAKQEGYKKAISELRARVRKHIDKYLSFLTQVADFVYKTASEEFKKSNFKISEIRTNFYFDTQRINILFIIDADYEVERNFCKLLINVEQSILETENFVVELLYLNKRERLLDETSINCDFPLIRKISTIK